MSGANAYGGVHVVGHDPGAYSAGQLESGASVGGATTALDPEFTGE